MFERIIFGRECFDTFCLNTILFCYACPMNTSVLFIEVVGSVALSFANVKNISVVRTLVDVCVIFAH